jgi:hypothetical protein
MRTKTLLIAAAALAVGIISSEAQVYSQNVVGYANIPLLGNQKYNAVANPFSIGVSNGINEVFTGLPNQSVVYLYDPVAAVYNTYGYDDSIGADPRNWYSGDFTATIDAMPIVAPGLGTFVVLPAASVNITNNFHGTVAVLVGATNTASYPQGAYGFTGSVIPFQGQPDIGTNINLIMPNQSLLYQWDPENTAFIISGYDASIQDHSNDWFTGGFDADLDNPPVLKVGDSFFIVPGGLGGSGTYDWKQTLRLP